MSDTGWLVAAGVSGLVTGAAILGAVWRWFDWRRIEREEEQRLSLELMEKQRRAERDARDLAKKLLAESEKSKLDLALKELEGQDGVMPAHRLHLILSDIFEIQRQVGLRDALEDVQSTADITTMDIEREEDDG